ncbi:MAG: isoleucine--tRNA ligase [Clostridiales Family XIII bacterium]|jgi:isoleucyl-tRNA synthetase|nr:isoleucine--tRNA ligase [Clostridiales Family XIII bacterium]
MFKNLDDRSIAEVQNEQALRWESEGLLAKCTEERQDRPAFIFYEGPPTANGKPGIHHVISRTLKDSVNRYYTMLGYRVPRKAGWDTHGLPVEIEVEKALGFYTKSDIEAYGIAAFNQKCRESVFKYEGMWREMSRRMGFLIDLDNPYITLAGDYIETGWWILKRFFDEGLIYEGHKILPYCPRCGTGLASHEVSLGYKEIKTNTVIVMFKRVKDSADAADEYFLAWTTTPWTLAANVALTVGPAIVYVKARVKTAGEREGKASEIAKEHGGKIVWVAKNLADKVLGAGGYEALCEKSGSELEGMDYEQLMPFADVYASGKPGARAFYVTAADYATDEDGTGIVHTAPAFGEDDYHTGRRYGLPVPNPVGEDGRYTATPWAGRFVLEEGLDIDIIRWLAEAGKLFSKEKIAHNYPFCWRCDTPLIYYSKPSWYIEMTKLKDQLVRNNDSVNWYPDYVGEKRFGNWLENVNDWAISRTRYWGTPIPIWRCADCGGLVCVGSRAELREKAMEEIPLDENGVPDIELHRPYVDDIHISCERCGGVMTRVPEVMDCWFDSGSMPFAQRHYPFEQEKEFDPGMFPADFICEGIDQTRGWFYSLMAISTFITGRAPYRNVLVNDLILDKDGKKMSKSKGNTADPFELFDRYGADATRWYLLYASPAWSPTKFDEDGLVEVAGKFFGTLRNVYQFFVLYAGQDEVDPRGFADLPAAARPEADRWILSRLAHLTGAVREEMGRYDHMRAVRKIQNFVIEDLSNWYIRRSRRRFWGAGLSEDKKAVYRTTWEVLLAVCKLMAPFAPFLADEMYLKLTLGAEGAPALTDHSVHLADFPAVAAADQDAALEEKMELVRAIVSLGRGVREKERLKVRQPLAGALVDGKYEALIGGMAGLIEEELNIKAVRFSSDTGAYMDYALKPNFKAAGPVFGPKVKAFAAALSALSGAEAAVFAAQLGAGNAAELAVDGEPVQITADLVDVKVSAKEGFAVAMEGGLFVAIDTTLTPELVQEGLAREFVSKVQQIRKAVGLEMMDRIEVYFEGGEEVARMAEDWGGYIAKETLADGLRRMHAPGQEKYDLNGHETLLGVRKN